MVQPKQMHSPFSLVLVVLPQIATVSSCKELILALKFTSLIYCLTVSELHKYKRHKHDISFLLHVPVVHRLFLFWYFCDLSYCLPLFLFVTEALSAAEPSG